MTKKESIPTDVIEQIHALLPEARLARRQHGPEDIKTQSSLELTAILTSLFDQGWSISQLAKASGITYHSVRARVKKVTPHVES